jgi:hypothetical protein
VPEGGDRNRISNIGYGHLCLKEEIETFLSPPSVTGDHSRYWLFCFYLLLQAQVAIADIGYSVSISSFRHR